MKFIFPQNYNFQNKLFGVIDYATAFFNIFWYLLIFFILHLLVHSLNVKIFLFIILCFPVLLFSVFGFYGENIIYVLSYVFKFLFKSKIIFYSKCCNMNTSKNTKIF